MAEVGPLGLWITTIFRFCGELWWISGYSGVRFGFRADFLGPNAKKRGFLNRKNVDKTWWIAWFLW
jgi:hypothetical protein